MTIPTTDHQHTHHVMSVKTYLSVFAALIVLLVITVAVGYADFGSWDKPVTILVAMTKAGLIIAYFMHLLHSNKLVWIFAGMGFFGLVIMLLIALSDYFARGTIPGVMGPAA